MRNPTLSADYKIINNEFRVSLDDTKLLRYLGNSSSVKIPSGITEIGPKAFVENKKLKNVYIPATVKIIGDRAFDSCINLESVIIPSNSELTEIDFRAFAACNKLVKINLPKTLLTIEKASFINCTNLDSSNIKFYNGFKHLGSSAFRNTSAFEVVIPESVETLDLDAFADCSNLETITINCNPNSLTGEIWAFKYNCIPENLKSIIFTKLIDDTLSAAKIVRLTDYTLKFNRLKYLTDIKFTGGISPILAVMMLSSLIYKDNAFNTNSAQMIGAILNSTDLDNVFKYLYRVRPEDHIRSFGPSLLDGDKVKITRDEFINSVSNKLSNTGEALLMMKWTEYVNKYFGSGRIKQTKNSGSFGGLTLIEKAKLTETFSWEMGLLLRHRVIKILLNNLTTDSKLLNTLCLLSLIMIMSNNYDEDTYNSPMDETVSRFRNSEDKLGKIMPDDLTKKEINQTFNLKEKDVKYMFDELLPKVIPDLDDYVYSEEEVEKMFKRK